MTESSEGEAVRRALIWAMARNRVIGRDGIMPWHLPRDLAFFKRTTLGKPVIMGRKTFQAIGRALPDRDNIVVSRGFTTDAPVTVVGSLDAAFALGERLARASDDAEVMVIGGAQIYAAALPTATRLYVTRIDADIEGDTYFPEVDLTRFTLLSHERFEADDSNAYPLDISVYERAAAAA